MSHQDKICEIIAIHCATPTGSVLEVKPEHQIGFGDAFGPDLNDDSLDRVEIVMALEDEFDLEIPDEDAANWKTVADVIAYVDGKAVGK